MVSPLISFRATDLLKNQIQERTDQTSLSTQACKDLKRYYSILEQALDRVQLTLNEAMLICDALNGTLFEFQFNPASSLFIEVEDAIALNNLDQKWSVCAERLLENLKSLSILEATAVIDAVQRFWLIPEADQETIKVIFKIK